VKSPSLPSQTLYIKSCFSGTPKTMPNGIPNPCKLSVQNLIVIIYILLLSIKAFPQRRIEFVTGRTGPRKTRAPGPLPSVYHEPTRVEPDHGLDPARLMSKETRAARALPQGSSLNLLVGARYHLLKGRTAGNRKDSHGSRFHWY